VGEQKKFVIKKETRALFLQQNQFRTIVGLSSVLKDVMWGSERLQWIDLSYNYLDKIEDELVTNFPNLKTLYLHGCYISNLEEVKKLNQLPELMTLTLYGNPIE
jgi:Leucine-rich repeat (LRR) protein